MQVRRRCLSRRRYVSRPAKGRPVARATRPHLLRRCFGFSADGPTALAMISPALREKASVSMGATPDISRFSEDCGSLLLPPVYRAAVCSSCLRNAGIGIRFRTEGARLSITQMPIRAYLEDPKFDPETTRVMGLAFEMAQAALRQLDGVRAPDEAVARRIIELALAGERDADVLCDRTLIDLRAQRSSSGP